MRKRFCSNMAGMENKLFNLSGKTALVTGGSRGIGFALAKGLAEHGADVAIIARNEKQLQTAKKQLQRSEQKVWTFRFDMASVERIGPLFQDVIADTEGVDILVNCAGTTARIAAAETDLETWNQIIGLNLTSVFVVSQAFCRHRKQVGKPGKVINIGSLMCHAARPTTAAYASSKGGILMLTRSLAVEWAKYNINVNAIGPGFIATDLTASLHADKDFNEWVLSTTPFARWGLPKDLVGAAVFLASSASDFVTGQILYVDGGWVATL
jgi:gluconate 5-dehydrogenase